jgi:hypothetical protein
MHGRPLVNPFPQAKGADTTMGYAAIYPEDVIAHRKAFIARRRTERPSEEYRTPTDAEWAEFLGPFVLCTCQVDGDGEVAGAGQGRTVSSGHWRRQRLALVS